MKKVLIVLALVAFTASFSINASTVVTTNSVETVAVSNGDKKDGECKKDDKKCCKSSCAKSCDAKGENK